MKFLTILFLLIIPFKFQMVETNFFFKEIGELKKLSNEELHDFLILKDWDYIKSESRGNRRYIGGTEVHEKFYSNSTNDIQLSFQNVEYYLPKGNGYEIWSHERIILLYTKDLTQYKNLLKEIYNAGFKVNGKETYLGNIEIASTTPEKLAKRFKTEFVNTQTSVKEYIDEKKNEVNLTTKVFEKEIEGTMVSYTSYSFEIKA